MKFLMGAVVALGLCLGFSTTTYAQGGEHVANALEAAAQSYYYNNEATDIISEAQDEWVEIYYTYVEPGCDTFCHYALDDVILHLNDALYWVNLGHEYAQSCADELVAARSANEIDGSEYIYYYDGTVALLENDLHYNYDLLSAIEAAIGALYNP